MTNPAQATSPTRVQRPMRRTRAPLVVEYADTRLEVDGRVRAIIEALLRDGEAMALNRVREGALRFTWGHGRLRWHLEQYGDSVADPEVVAA